MDREAWHATVHGVAKSWTWLSMCTHTHTHISWKIRFCMSRVEIHELSLNIFCYLESYTLKGKLGSTKKVSLGSKWKQPKCPSAGGQTHELWYTHGVVVQSLSHVRLFATLWIAAPRLPCPSPSPRACSNSCPLSQWSHPASHPLLFPSPPDFNLYQHQGLFQWVSSSYQVAKVLELQLQQ